MDILPTASYIQNHELLRSHQHKRVALDAILDNDEATDNVSRRVWELLETPQTILSIVRVVAKEYDIEVAECTCDVEASLAQLYRADLIQLSPDA